MTGPSLLTQNSELRAIGVWNWTLPAWAGRLPDGRTYNTCPSAGVCRQACYALNGTYRFPGVLARHEANLRFFLDAPVQWEAAMSDELAHDRYRGAWIRVHDSGDFFSAPYLRAWLRIMRDRPNTGFYAYTKSVALFREWVEPNPPGNFFWVFSYGGTEDASLDPAADRVADVFPDEDSIAAAGWNSQEASDLLAVLGPNLVGVPANRIPHFVKKMAGRTFREWQAEADALRIGRRQLTGGGVR